MPARIKPLLKQTAATNIALRGPARSTHLPPNAAESPRTRMARLKIHPSSGTVQSTPGFGAVMPIACDIGLVKTLKAYASPMQRWMQSAAGGTSHRLKPGFAIAFDRSKKAMGYGDATIRAVL